MARGSARARLENIKARLGSTKYWLGLGSARKKFKISGSWLGSARETFGSARAENRNFRLVSPLIGMLSVNFVDMFVVSVL